jgi:hypothetical protein
MMLVMESVVYLPSSDCFDKPNQSHCNLVVEAWTDYTASNLGVQQMMPSSVQWVSRQMTRTMNIQLQKTQTPQEAKKFSSDAV